MKTSSIENKAYKTLGDAARLMAEKRMSVVENSLTQYIKSAIDLLQAQGKDIEEYALCQVDSPMTFTDNTTVTIKQQWRLVHTSKLEHIPQAAEDEN